MNKPAKGIINRTTLDASAAVAMKSKYVPTRDEILAKFVSFEVKLAQHLFVYHEFFPKL